MNRRFGLILAGLVLVGGICIWGVQQKGDITFATATGTVTVGQDMAVRTGPGTNYDYLTQDGRTVKVSDESEVTILAQSKKWYKIRFAYESLEMTGYIPAKYLSVMSGDTYTEVGGKVSASAVLVRSRAVQSGSLLRDDGTAIRLMKDKKVRLLSESIIYGVHYYKISFSRGGTQWEGYVPAQSIKADYTSAIPGVIKTSGQAALKEKAGSTAIVQGATGQVLLSSGTEVLMLGEKTVSGVKYIQVDVVYNGESYSGYVLSNLVRMEQMEVEEEVKGEQVDFTTPEETEEPAATEVPIHSLDSSNKSSAAKSSNKSATKATDTVSDKEFKQQLVDEGFPSSYIDALLALHEKYPNWQFKAYQTGIDWSTAVDNESVVGLNLLSNSKSSDWKSKEEGAYNASTDTYIPFDGSTWVTASEKAVRYYMDPRNFLTEDSIFQFESLEYQEGEQTKSGVENVLKNTPMYKTEYTYINDSGEEATITYSQTFMEAAASSGVSPYHLASRVKQEVVTGTTTMSSSVSGTVKGYEGIYNFYNIGANNSTKSGGAVANGLAWANKDTTYLRPWNTIYKAIVGGAQYLGSNYINVGQNTLYLQKFNVTSTSTYNHQYMANIEAPASEALKTATAYGDDKADMSIVFSIPVYYGMPSEVCPEPSGDSTSSNNYLKTLKVKGHTFRTPFQSGDDGSTIYSVTVSHKVSSVKINATPVASTAKVTGTGSKKLKTGTKTYTIKVKAESGSIRRYKIKITRKKK